MIYDASISYNLYYVLIIFLFLFASILFFVILIPPMDKPVFIAKRTGVPLRKLLQGSLKISAFSFLAGILIYMFFPLFWHVNFFNLPFSKNKNYFTPPDTSKKSISLPGFSLEFSLTSGKVWDDPQPILLLKTSHLNRLHYLKGVIYDHFNGRTWKTTYSRRYQLKNYSWQLRVPFESKDMINYETDSQVITYLTEIPNIMFYENYPIVIRFPANKVFMSEISNIYIPRILKFPFTYSVVSKLPLKILPAANIWDIDISFDKYLQIPYLSKRTVDLSNVITKSEVDDYDKALALASYLRTNYKYSDEFSFLPNRSDLVDYFLFVYKKGYCEQFATVYAIMLRSTGIPSRVVSGFAGGEYDPKQNGILFRGRHAHAWVEAYFPQYGWLTMDATPVSERSLKINKQSFFSKIAGIFSTDPQNLIPKRVKQKFKKMMIVSFNFIKNHYLISIVLFLLIIASIMFYIPFKEFLHLKKLMKNIDDDPYVLFYRLEKFFPLEREKSETEIEFTKRIKAKYPKIIKLLNKFLENYIYIKYKEALKEEYREKIIVLLKILKNIKKSLKKN